MGDGVSLPIPPQFGCDECILTHITSYQNQKRGKSRAKPLGSSWYLTPLLWDTILSNYEVFYTEAGDPLIHLGWGVYTGARQAKRVQCKPDMFGETVSY